MLLKIADIILAPVVFLASIPMKISRKRSMRQLPLTAAAYRKAGIFPVTSHYYEPLFDMSGVDLSGDPRDLPGIDFGHEGQVKLLGSFQADDMPPGLDQPAKDELSYSYQNRNFGRGDADLWYHVIRHFKPRRIFEIGSGHSTKMARLAVDINCADDAGYECRHLCIEPYEMPWLENLGIEIRREKLEHVEMAMFAELEANDILFIDSSHMIRPGGEVLLEFLQLLPQLKPGVIVHVHDIFTPRDYPARWLADPRFWNEQYLLEAFLSHNGDWEILVAGNYLAHSEPELMEKSCPYFRAGEDEPGSFYMRRVK